MIPLRLTCVLFFVCLTSTVDAEDKAATAGSQRSASDPAITIRKIDGLIDHNHCTTRQFQHMTFHHEGVWFGF